MNIFVDENIPYANEFFNDFGTLTRFAGRELTAEQVKDADILLVRSITKVNRELLHLNQKVKFVGTATIGVDHVDQAYLAERGIGFSNAAGCNAVSVAEYVVSSLLVLKQRYQLDLQSLEVGIVGAGNTGSRLSEKLDALGIAYKLCDPFLEESGDGRDFYSLDEVLSCDVISLHVPLTQSGPHPTYHLLDEARINALSEQHILINACRGEVVDNQALYQRKLNGSALKLVLDVWEGEPEPLRALIPFTEIASAHIAGYSLEGKSRGTEMLYQVVCELLGEKVQHSLDTLLPAFGIDSLSLHQTSKLEAIEQAMTLVYDVRRDDGIFRSQLEVCGFDTIRKQYPVRREFSALTLANVPAELQSITTDLGFKQHD